MSPTQGRRQEHDGSPTAGCMLQEQDMSSQRANAEALCTTTLVQEVAHVCEGEMK